MEKKKTAKNREQTWDEIGEAIGKKIEKGCKDGDCMPWKKNIKEHVHKNGCHGAFYGLGFIGALVYFVSQAAGFWAGVLGILKAIVWPAFFVYGMLKFLGV